jgi:signal peptidase II
MNQLKPRTRLHALLILIVVIISCDQATKRYAASHLKDAPRQSYFRDTIRVEYAENEGAFLGLGQRWSPSVRFWLFVVGNGILLSWIGIWIWQHRTAPMSQTLGLALIWGGGISNFADRILSDGRVVDFLNLGIGSLRTGIFNVADVAIMAGVGLLVLVWTKNTKGVTKTEGTHGVSR